MPLTLFEQYLLHEDQPGYPSRIVQELQFNGSVNREFFEKSVHEITAMHPLLTATVEKGLSAHPIGESTIRALSPSTGTSIIPILFDRN